MNGIKYVQLEPSAFLSDIDFQMMNAEERGVYVSIILYLYCNGGKLKLNDNNDITLLKNCYTRLAMLSGCSKTGEEWAAIWGKIRHKFQINGNNLTHKRVTEELKKAKEHKEKRSKAGKKGMANRYSSNTVSNNDITNISKGKVSKGKKKKEVKERKDKNSTDSKIPEITDKVIKKWESKIGEVNGFESERVAMEISRLLDYTNVNRITEQELFQAIDNYAKARKVKKSLAGNFKLARFIQRLGTEPGKCYLPAYFQLENFGDEDKLQNIFKKIKEKQ